jgi:hypothetical protein
MYLNISKKWLAYNKVNVAILIFLLSFSIFHYIKPGFAYTNEGGYRHFGLGFRNKTVIPVWIVAIILSILSYLFVLFLLR